MAMRRMKKAGAKKAMKKRSMRKKKIIDLMT